MGTSYFQNQTNLQLLGTHKHRLIYIRTEIVSNRIQSLCFLQKDHCRLSRCSLPPGSDTWMEAATCLCISHIPIRFSGFMFTEPDKSVEWHPPQTDSIFSLDTSGYLLLARFLRTKLATAFLSFTHAENVNKSESLEASQQIISLFIFIRFCSSVFECLFVLFTPSVFPTLLYCAVFTNMSIFPLLS